MKIGRTQGGVATEVGGLLGMDLAGLRGQGAARLVGTFGRGCGGRRCAECPEQLRLTPRTKMGKTSPERIEKSRCAAIGILHLCEGGEGKKSRQLVSSADDAMPDDDGRGLERTAGAPHVIAQKKPNW